MGHDRVTELRIAGMRTIDKLTLKLDRLTVLIGENGSGKSTILEACEILRRTASAEFIRDFHAIHGGMFSLLRQGAGELHLGITVEGEGVPLAYDLVLGATGPSAALLRETLVYLPRDDREPLIDVDASERRARIDGQTLAAGQFDAGQTALSTFGRAKSSISIRRAARAMEGIEVHLPFEVLPAWAARAPKRESSMRSEALQQPADRLERLGTNLASAYDALKNEYGDAHWRRTMDLVRLGLGGQVDSVNVRKGPGGGTGSLWLKLEGLDDQISASVLSDGTLAYLAFVAMVCLPSKHPKRSLLAFDEPDLHLHPALLVRVLGLLEDVAETCPVLLATHSDTLLDALREPWKAVRLCELVEPGRVTRLHQPDEEALERWRDDYRLGHLRREGYLDTVMKPTEPVP
jgi:predicted ATPase